LDRKFYATVKILTENAGDVQWKERCEESVVKLEELTGIPDTGTSSFTEYARRG
jgi:hypothetical protein